jgi:hypothetical protein
VWVILKHTELDPSRSAGVPRIGYAALEEAFGTID